LSLTARPTAAELVRRRVAVIFAGTAARDTVDFFIREYVQAGGLMSYGASITSISPEHVLISTPEENRFVAVRSPNIRTTEWSRAPWMEKLRCRE
jgi:hypothetical protein